MNASNIVKLIGLSVIAVGTTGCQTMSELSPFSSSFMDGFSKGICGGFGIATAKNPLTQAGDAVKILSASSGAGSISTAPARKPIVTFASTAPAASTPAQKEQQDCPCHRVRLHNGKTGIYYDVLPESHIADAIRMSQWTYGGNKDDIRIVDRNVPCPTK